MRANHRGRKAVWVIVLALTIGLIAPAGALGQSQSITGHWEGRIELPGTALAISIDFAEKPGAAISGSVSIPAQGAKDLPLSGISVSGSDVGFDLPGVPGEPKFKGKLDAGGASIKGDFTQAGRSFPFVLERKENPSDAARKALEGFDPVALDSMKKFSVPGMAIAVVKGKEVVYSKGFGYRDVEKQEAVTADTLFAIGSSTKAFTTFVLGTLVDEGKIEWDKPVRNYIPWFKLYDPFASERIAPRDLVTHRSGLPRHDLIWYNNYGASRKSLVQKLPFLEPSADLRTKFQYNNLMFLTAGYLSEVVTGKSWEDNVRERILDPLGMKRSNFSIDDSQKDSDFAEPYQKKDGKVVRMPFRRITNIGPAGSINSSVNEMIRWVTVHINGGEYQGKRLANAATVEDMHAPHMVLGAPGPFPEVSPADYGMGWFIDTYRGHRRVYHGGNIDGFSANVILFPQDDLGIVILTNLNGTPLRDLIGQVMADRLLNLSAKDWIGEAAAKMAVAEAAAKEGEKKKAVARVANTQPSHKLEDYAGNYEHPGYGILKIGFADGTLTATFNDITTPLEHWHYDTFNGMKADDASFENMKYTFQTDARGYISAVTAPFEPAVKDIVFSKKPDAKFYDADYLKRFVGKYDLPGQQLTISVKGNELMASLANQPPLELVPVLGGDFALKQVAIVTIHFLVGEKGEVAGLELRQPGTTLTAKRAQ